jgi:hypothetical protein
MGEFIAHRIDHERERIAVGGQKQTAILANVRKVRGVFVESSAEEIGGADVASGWIASNAAI